MIVLDRLLAGGLRFVLDKLREAAEAEHGDDTALKELLLEAQMQLELGEISEEEFAELEAEILPRMREIQERRMAAADGPIEGAVADVALSEDATWEAMDEGGEAAPGPTPDEQEGAPPKRKRRKRR